MTVMTRFLFPIFAILLLLAAPAFAEEHKSSDGGEGEKPAEPGADPNAPLYVEISPFVIPVLGPNGPEEMVSLIVTLELAPGVDRAIYVKQRLPKLNDAYVQSLYGALDRKTVKRGGLVDVSLVKAKLQKATDRILGPGYVQDVLVQAVAQRKVRGN